MKQRTEIIWLVLFVLLFTASRSLGEAKRFVYPKAEIRMQVQNFVAHHFAQSDSRYQIEWLQDIPEVRLLQRPDSIAVSSNGGNRWWGNRVIRVAFYSRGKALRSIYVSVRIRVFGKVWITVQSIRQGEVISARQLVQKETEITNFNEAPFTFSQTSHWIARRHIAANRILLQRDVREPFLVQKGHHLDVEYHSGAIRIKLKALALQNGGNGELIWVKNLENRKRLRVKVIGPALAVVP